MSDLSLQIYTKLKSYVLNNVEISKFEINEILKYLIIIYIIFYF